jgi:endonuclease/exonuclease/phosphatase family metal-dependent hydrolase
MKKHLLIALSALCSVALSITADIAKTDLTVIDWNVTHANKKEDKNIKNWDKRKAHVVNFIEKTKDDMYCLQEIIEDNGQLKTIQNSLPGYGWVGEKRNSHLKDNATWWLSLTSYFATDEYCPIFYNKEKLELLNTQTFGINTGGDDYLPRIATLACFKQKATNKEFCVCNTHLEHKTDNKGYFAKYDYDKVRSEQVKIIINKLKNYSNKPILLMGDFNTTFDGDLKKVLTQAGFIHGKKIAEQIGGPEVTHEKSSTKKLIECDHILVKPQEKFSIEEYEIIDAMSPTTSDHNPVKMTFSLN